jgi:hypothetical protein
MARRRARHRVARRHRGGPGAHGGRPPALPPHTIPYLDNSAARTTAAHPGADISRSQADNAYPLADDVRTKDDAHS